MHAIIKSKQISEKSIQSIKRSSITKYGISKTEFAKRTKNENKRQQNVRTAKQLVATKSSRYCYKKVKKIYNLERITRLLWTKLYQIVVVAAVVAKIFIDTNTNSLNRLGYFFIPILLTLQIGDSNVHGSYVCLDEYINIHISSTDTENSQQLRVRIINIY